MQLQLLNLTHQLMHFYIQ